MEMFYHGTKRRGSSTNIASVHDAVLGPLNGCLCPICSILLLEKKGVVECCDMYSLSETRFSHWTSC